MSIAGIHSPTCGKDEWLTPPWLIDSLGHFDLDPCSPIVRPWATAEKHFTINDDGLAQTWSGRVFCNPPYGKKTGLWLSKCAEHKNAIALIYARTETTDWFDKIWPVAHSILFIKGRLFFHHVDGSRADDNSGGPSALIAFDGANGRALAGSNIAGKFIRLKFD